MTPLFKLLVLAGLCHLAKVYKPLIPRLKSSISQQYVLRGSKYSYLECESTTDGVLFYNVYKDDILLRRWNSSFGRFLYRFSSQDDGGRLSCTVVSTVGESEKSNEISITVFEQPQVISNIDDPDLGDTLTLTCDPTIPISSDFNIKWHKNSEYMNHNGSTLILETLQEEDAGVYNCQLEFDDRLGISQTTSPHGFLIVFDVPPPPSLKVPDGPVMHRRYLDLSCSQTTIDPSHGILRSALYFNGQKVGERSLSQRFREPARYRATGSYSCSSINRRGESPQSNDYKITIENWVPSDWYYANNYRTPQVRNRGYTARCYSSISFQTYSADYCSLFVNGERYAQSSACYQFWLTHGVSGDLQCSATDVQGTSAMSSVQSVSFFDEPVIRPVKETPPVMGESYTLKCVTDAERRGLTIHWLMNFNDEPILHTGSNFLINPVAQGKEHGYRCRITNERSYGHYSPLFIFRVSSLSTTPTTIYNNNNAPDIRIYCSSSRSYKGATLYKDSKKMSESAIGNFLPVFLSRRLGVSVTCRGHTIFGPVKQSDNLYFSPQAGEIQVLSNPSIASLGQRITLTCSSSVTENARFVWEVQSISSSAPRSLPGRVLNLDPVNHGDRGVYTCQVIVEYPEGKMTLNSPPYLITFSVPLVPRLYTNGGNLSCRSADFDCDFLNPFRLYRDGVLVPGSYYGDIRVVKYYDFLLRKPENRIVQKFSIDIKSASAGNYTCTAVNYVGESTPSIPVAIEDPVELSLTADNPLASLGDDVTMTCSLPRDTPESKIIWYMNNKQLFRTGKNLTLNKLTLEDHGFYTCSFNGVKSNGYMIALQAPLQPILLHMTTAGHALDYRPRPNNRDSQMFQTAVAEGSQVFLSCFSESPGVGYLPAHVTNANQVYSLWSEGQLVMDNDQDGDFIVTAPSVGDYPYRCQSRNNFGSSEMSWPTVVKVEERPVIQSSESPELVNIGDNISLSCETTKNSDGYDITWKKNGKELLEIRPTLVLNSVNEYDEGIYTCRQKVGSWTLPSSAGLTLLPLDRAAKPELYSSEGATIRTMSDGSKLKLYCLSSSTTASIATFKLRGTTIATSEDPDYDEASQIQFTYEMDKVDVSDSGDYTCTVTNGDGKSLDSEPFSLIVVACEAGKWGPECTTDCSGNCGGTGACDRANGHCTYGCKPGYKNDLCDKPCEHPFYGSSCNMACSVNCRSSSIQHDTHFTLCHHVHGQCLWGCQGSFYGPTCEEIDHTDDFGANTIGIALGAVVALLVLVVLVLAALYIRERRHRTSTSKTETTPMSDIKDRESATGRYTNSPTKTMPEPQRHAYANAGLVSQDVDTPQDDATDTYQAVDDGCVQTVAALQESVQGNEMKSSWTNSETQGSAYNSEGLLNYEIVSPQDEADHTYQTVDGGYANIVPHGSGDVYEIQ